MRVLPIFAILLFARSTSAQPTAPEPQRGGFAEPPPGETPPTAPPVAPPRASPVETLVRHTLLEPLAAREDKQSRFSRARLPPQERRVRILDGHPRRDARGDSFVRFAVDARHGFARDEAWTTDDITGCVYLARGDV